MKKLAILVLAFSFIVVASSAFALSTAEQRYGTTKVATAMTIHYKNSTVPCSIAFNTGTIRVTVSGSAVTGLGNNGTISWSTSADSSHVSTIGELVSLFNSIDNFEAVIVDAMEGDSIARLTFTACPYASTATYTVGFQNTYGGETCAYSQIRIHNLPGQKVTLRKVYTNGDTGNLIIYKGNTEIWRQQVEATVVLASLGDTWHVGPSYTTTKIDGTIEFVNGLDAFYSYDGLNDLTIKMLNGNTDSWGGAQWLQIEYDKVKLE
ncbi:MAG: hypothetical protein PHY56_00035 [Candidatus Omnitrophica bacterium]|nr:hypothetical protein [Candidatus Omnitrophota bacterium]